MTTLPSYRYDHNNFDYIDHMIYVGSEHGAYDLMNGQLQQPTNPLPTGGWAILNVAWDLDIEYKSSAYKNPPYGDLVNQHHKVGLVDGTGNLPSTLASAVLMVYQLATAREYLCPKDQNTYPPVENILVHCHEGDSRSVTVAALYLSIIDNKNYPSVQDAVTAILKKRNLTQAPQTTYLINLANDATTVALINAGMETQYLKPSSPCTLQS